MTFPTFKYLVALHCGVFVLLFLFCFVLFSFNSSFALFRAVMRGLAVELALEHGLRRWGRRR